MEASLFVCGLNQNNGINEISNNVTFRGYPIIDPPISLSIDVSKLISYWTFSHRTIFVSDNGEAYAIGSNEEGAISRSLPTHLDKFRKLDFKDKSGTQFNFISAVCGEFYSLYLISLQGKKNKTHLAYSSNKITSQYPVILDTRKQQILSIYGGFSDCAAIDIEGCIIYIHNTFSESSPNSIETVFLPDGEKAVSIAWCHCVNTVYALSSNGRVYESKIHHKLNFRLNKELKDELIICISGVFDHCLALTDKNVIYLVGSTSISSDPMNTSTTMNFKFIKHPYYSLEKAETSVDGFDNPSFLYVGDFGPMCNSSSMYKDKIVAVYAGFDHSIVQAKSGSVTSFGSNDCHQLVFSYLPTKESISFCVAGYFSSSYFVNFVPKHSPNTKISYEIIKPSKQISFLYKPIIDDEVNKKKV